MLALLFLGNSIPSPPASPKLTASYQGSLNFDITSFTRSPLTAPSQAPTIFPFDYIYDSEKRLLVYTHTTHLSLL